jgi:uncharacterized Zn finger protein
MKRLKREVSIDSAKTRQKLLDEAWWTSEFLNMMKPDSRITTQLAKGRQLAERGRVMVSDLFPGGISTIVLGAVGGSHRAFLWVMDLEDEWEVIYRILAGNQDLYNRLLSGDYPKELDALFEEAQINIIPSTIQDLDFKCDCEGDSTICSHIVATYLALGRYVNEDPMVLFQLRGKTRDEIIQAVTHYINGPSDETDNDSINENIPETEAYDPPEPTQYYEPVIDIGQIKIRTKNPLGKEKELFRSLGPCPFSLGKINLAHLIEVIYPIAAVYARQFGNDPQAEKKSLKKQILIQSPQ